MGYCDERVKELWAYKTTFGSINFNIVSVVWNVLQILTTCIILGTYHKHITIEYLWWPVFESLRILILTFARLDVLLKDNFEFRDNEASFVQTRRIIMFSNFIGIGSLSIGCLLYLFLLPDDKSKYYYLYMIFFPTFVIIRILLTTPMFYVLLCNTSFYSNDYLPLGEFNNQRTEIPIDNDENNNNTNNNNSNINNNSNNINSSNPNISENSVINEDLIWNAIEQRQMQLAVQASQHDIARSMREEQDKEYERLEKQQKELNTVGSLIDSDTGDKSNLNDKEDSIYGKKISIDDLDDLIDEEEKSNSSVVIRIRLPNGIKSERRFHYSHTIHNVKNWINHELLNNNLHEYIFNFRLLSTMPRIVYGENKKGGEETLKECGFWRDNSKREGQSPPLYVELDE